MPSLLRSRNFALLFAGESISDLGSAVTVVAFPLVAIAVLHASAFQVGLIAAATNAAWLFVALPAGAVVDRIHRRPVLIATDLGRAAVLCSVPLAYAGGVLTVGQLIAVAFGISVGTVIFDTAYPAFLPSVVPAHRLVEGNGILEASTNSAFVAGPSLGGVLVQVIGAPVTLLADVGSYLVSAVAVSAIRVTEPDRARHSRGGLLREIGDGLRYVRRHPLIKVLIVAVTVANFTFGIYTAVVVVFLARQLAVAPGLIGLLFAAGAIGGIAGALSAGPLAGRIGDARVLWLSATVNVPAILTLTLSGGGAALVWFVAGLLVLNAGIALFNVNVRAAIQRSTPAEMLGRTTASIRVFSRGALPVGSLAGGAIAGVSSPRAALVVMLALYVIVPVRLYVSAIGRVRSITELGMADGDAAAVPPTTDRHVGSSSVPAPEHG